jgi:hypothetical protein
MTEEYKPVTAEDVLAAHGDPVAEERAKTAADAGVVAPEYAGYEEALENYEARSDVETLANRRARENGTSFRDAAFRREVGGDEDEGGVVTSEKATQTKPEQTKNFKDK